MAASIINTEGYHYLWSTGAEKLQVQQMPFKVEDFHPQEILYIWVNEDQVSVYSSFHKQTACCQAYYNQETGTKWKKHVRLKLFSVGKCQHLTLTQIWSPVQLVMLNGTTKPYQIQLPTPNTKAVAT